MKRKPTLPPQPGAPRLRHSIQPRDVGDPPPDRPPPPLQLTQLTAMKSTILTKDAKPLVPRNTNGIRPRAETDAAPDEQHKLPAQGKSPQQVALDQLKCELKGVL